MIKVNNIEVDFDTHYIIVEEDSLFLTLQNQNEPFTSTKYVEVVAEAMERHTLSQGLVKIKIEAYRFAVIGKHLVRHDLTFDHTGRITSAKTSIIQKNIEHQN